ncbi:MAG: allophanate hydrolase-related protein, partial [Verrucomicrobiales bacterium]
VAIEEFLQEKPEEVFSVTREIIAGGEFPLASDGFRAQYRLADCKRRADQLMRGLDFVLTPTAPRNFTLAEVAAEPIRLNSILGTYTNFMNLLDYAALALPAGRYEGRLPWGVTLFAAPGSDRALLSLGARYEAVISRPVDEVAKEGFDEIEIAVCGAHLSGMPLNHQLSERGGEWLASTRTAPCYEMFCLPAGEGLPPRPALIKSAQGVAIEVEVWTLSREAFGDFVAAIPGPLGIGKVELADGREVPGFIAEARAAEGAENISSYGGWRAYLAAQG